MISQKSVILTRRIGAFLLALLMVGVILPIAASASPIASEEELELADALNPRAGWGAFVSFRHTNGSTVMFDASNGQNHVGRGGCFLGLFLANRASFVSLARVSLRNMGFYRVENSGNSGVWNDNMLDPIRRMNGDDSATFIVLTAWRDRIQPRVGNIQQNFLLDNFW